MSIVLKLCFVTICVQVPPCLSSGDVIIDCQWEVQTFRRLDSVLGPITGVELPKKVFTFRAR
jgi:hypothetical protein